MKAKTPSNKSLLLISWTDKYKYGWQKGNVAIVGGFFVATCIIK